MQTQRTLGDLQNIIGDLFPSGASFISLLNQACERILSEGKWRGTIATVDFATGAAGFVTLPYPYLSIIGAQWYKCPVPVFTVNHSYIESGPGQLDPTKPPTGIFVDMRDGFATQADIPTDGSTLRIVLDLGIDIGKTFRFFGNGATREIFSLGVAGMDILTTGLTTNNATVFSEVTGIETPVDSAGNSTMVGGWTLYSVAPDTTATELGYYYPIEARPSYRRYYTGTTDKAIRVLCQRRFIPVANSTDWVIPGNIGAIKAAMQAIQCEDANNREQAETMWQKCWDILNHEAHTLRGSAKPELSLPQSQFDPGGYGFGWGYRC